MKHCFNSMPVNEISSNPRTILLTQEVIEAALKNDLGPEWSLSHFEMKDFTKKGDNYISAVTGLLCSGTFNGMKKDTYYVAKVNPLRPTTAIEGLTHNFFYKEGCFMTQLSGKLNKILNDIEHPVLNVPECFFFSSTKGREIMISRDLRKRGFQMHDINLGMNLNHSELVVKEIAKLHSSSVILKRTLKHDILDLFPFLIDDWLIPNTNGNALLTALLKTQANITINLIEQMPEYDKQREWLQSIEKNASDILFNALAESKENMRVICHGDCYNNNFLFRYDTQGNPIQIALLDLQICRYGSVALDLNYFMYTSMTGEMRNTYYDHLLSVYYKEFQDVLTAANIATMPFTEGELRKEVRGKAKYGVLVGLHMLPLILNLSEGNDAFDYDEVEDQEHLEEGIQGLRNSTYKLFNSSPIFRSRLLAVLDDALKMGLTGE